jgi:hypothetical protein
VGSLMVLVWDGGTVPVVAPPTDAKLRIEERKAGRVAVKRREVVRRAAMVEGSVGWMA